MLEVIAEAEVAQHFEERVVTRRVADVFQVVVLSPRAHTALRGHRAHVFAFLFAQKTVCELVHAGVGK